MEQVKTCSKCGEVKPLDAFNKKYGLARSSCRTCDHKSFSNWYENKPDGTLEKARIRSAIWRKNNPDRYKAQQISWIKSHPEHSKALRKKYQAEIVRKLDPAYIRHCIIGRTPRSIVSAADIPNDILEAKREQLTVYRLTKELINVLKEKQNGTK